MVRPSEWLMLANFVYLSALAMALPLRAPIPAVAITLNATILAGYVLLIWADSFRRGLLLGATRDWLPLPLMLLTYREMGWFARPRLTFDLERAWILWDRRLLDAGLRAAVESLGPLIPAVLEISYAQIGRAHV